MGELMQSLKDQLIELEQHLLKPNVRSSREELDRLLTDDFMEIPSTGSSYFKVDALNRIPSETSPEFTQQNYELRVLSENVMQLIYKATIKCPNSTVIKHSMRNSVWKYNGSLWQMAFHQGTPCEPFTISP